MTTEFLQEQDIQKSYRILNIGATTLIGASHNGDMDFMAAAWAAATSSTQTWAQALAPRQSQAELPEAQ